MWTIVSGAFARAGQLWERARREHSTPREVALAVAVGVFAGCTPFFGFHMWIALGLATVLRLNRLWAFLGSRCSVVPIYAWIGFCEIAVAHRLRTGVWAPLTPADVIARGGELLKDWLVGAVLVGTALATLAGCVAYALARGWERGVRQQQRSPAGSRRPSSESPRSAPRTPIP
jgi:hypothetical protein